MFACGVRTDGTLSCWGDPGYMDWRLQGPLDGEYKSVNMRDKNACAIRTDATETCWGRLSDFSACVVKDDGIVVCSGYSRDGTYRSIDAGRAGYCGVRTDGTVACWGGLSVLILDSMYHSVGVGGWGGGYYCTLGLEGKVECLGDHRAGEISPLPGQFQSFIPAACGPTERSNAEVPTSTESRLKCQDRDGGVWLWRLWR